MKTVLVLCLFIFFRVPQVYGFPQKEVRNAAVNTRTFTDSSGRQVEIPAEIKRISPSGVLAQVFLVSFAPDLLCSLSVPPTSVEKEFIPALSLPVTGQFYGQGGFNPEEIARLAPDCIIDIGDPKTGIASDMDGITTATGIPVIHITAGTRSTPDAFRTLGKLLAREEKGELLAAYCEKVLFLADTVSQRAVSRKTALFCTGRSGMNVLAKGSFHSEIFDWFVDNLAVVHNPSARATGNETNPEQLLLWDPQVVIFGPDTVFSGENDPLWGQLRAIKNRQYFKTPEGPYNWMGAPPSINRYLGILWIAKQLYPQFADYDLYAECKEYYELFYGYALSRQRFEQLTERR
ncbi:MAG: ABC transporter substrate-binding protein [Treponema sp.]|jgi:iron complex transport system substrate-binding protein|nr:ABC transporter substrate-binding protein [Treponema sp.]